MATKGDSMLQNTYTLECFKKKRNKKCFSFVKCIWTKSIFFLHPNPIQMQNKFSPKFNFSFKTVLRLHNFCLQTQIQTCFIYILDSSFSSSSKFWSSKFPSGSICSKKSSSNDNWNDWMLSLEITFHCTAKEIGAKATFLF